MERDIVSHEHKLPVERAYVVSIVIRSFKGRRDVDVHLYRPVWDESEEKSCPWDRILAHSPDGSKRNQTMLSRKMVMESFTRAERDQLVAYLEERYSHKLRLIRSAPLSFPVPAGLMPLSVMPENENHGRIRFDEIPNYSLHFPVHGFYDLSAHSPILAGEDS